MGDDVTVTRSLEAKKLWLSGAFLSMHKLRVPAKRS